MSRSPHAGATSRAHASPPPSPQASPAQTPAPRSPLPAPRSPLPAPCSLLPAPCSPLPAPRSLLPAPRSPLPAPRSAPPETNPSSEALAEGTLALRSPITRHHAQRRASRAQSHAQPTSPSPSWHHRSCEHGEHAACPKRAWWHACQERWGDSQIFGVGAGPGSSGNMGECEERSPGSATKAVWMNGWCRIRVGQG